MEGDASQQFGKYALIRRLAVGGMAEIFLAEHHGEAGFVRQVVIKRVLPNLSENPDFVTMFLDEARLLARLTHPNVVHIYDFGRIDDLYFLSLEYVHGGNLREVLIRQRGVPVPLGQALFIVGQALAGLDHAHRARGPDGAPLRLVHRDISPSNILLSLDGSVKVADFGIARSTVQQVHTAAFVIKGKLAYMSPEQVTGRPLDGRSDLFSVGVVLFEMLTGRRLFSRDSAADIQRAICADPIPPVLSLRPDLPAPVVELLEKALGRDREERFQTAASMQMAVDECMARCRLVGGAQHLGIFMKQVFPELAEDGAFVDDNAPTVMRDPVPYQPGTEILLEQSSPGTAPGRLRPAVAEAPPVGDRTALTPSGSLLAPRPMEPLPAPPRTLTPLGVVPPRRPTPLGVVPPRTPTPLGVVPRPVPPAVTPPPLVPAPPPGLPGSGPIPMPVEPHRSAPVSAPLNLPPSASMDMVTMEPTRPLVPPLSSARTSPLVKLPPPLVALAPALLSLKAWAVAQWPTITIGGAALVIGAVALWLMFSGGGSEPGYAGPVDATPAADGGDARLAPVRPRDAGAASARRPTRDAAVQRDAGARRAAAGQPDAAAAGTDGGPGPRHVTPGGPTTHAESPGMLSIQARPSATAILDGRKLGETPIYRRRTPSGWHTLELRAPGHPSLRRRIYIQPNREFKRTFDLSAADKGN